MHEVRIIKGLTQFVFQNTVAIQRLSNPQDSLPCRAAYTNISALLSLGPSFSKKHIGKFFSLWQTSVENAKKGREDFEDVHDLICLDAALQSVLSFTRNCPTLLLDIPDALTRTSILLESVLECVSGEGV